MHIYVYLSIIIRAPFAFCNEEIERKKEEEGKRQTVDD